MVTILEEFNHIPAEDDAIVPAGHSGLLSPNMASRWGKKRLRDPDKRFVWEAPQRYTIYVMQSIQLQSHMGLQPIKTSYDLRSAVGFSNS